MATILDAPAADADNEGGLIAVFDPTTGDQIGEVADGGAAAVDDAVASARESFTAMRWRGLPARDRAKVMHRAADLIDAQLPELMRAETLNNGMPKLLAQFTIANGAEMLRYNAGWCTRILGQTSDVITDGAIGGGRIEYHAYTRKEPMGVAGLITPWNVPLSMALAKLAPALAAGCSCVLKPAEETPLTSLLLTDIFRAAGLPDGVLNIVTGYGHTTGAALAAHDGVDKIGFTGSTEVGKLIVKAAAGNLKKVTLELGGKSPVLMFDDADLAKAIPGAAIGVFANSGQVCIAGTRLFAHRRIYDRVVEGLAGVAGALRLGSGLEETTDLGPLISRKQQDRVLAYIDEGRAAGATVVAGGKRLDRPGFFVEPTVLANVTPDMRLFQEEIFGPVIAVVPFDEEDEAIALANDSSYGLASAIWIRDISRAHRVAKRIEAGTVWINCQLANDPSVPFGGYKQSGWGRENGWEGVDAYLQTKSVFAEL